MTIDGAIKILEFAHRTDIYGLTSLDKTAIQLGIEALKQIKYLHEIHVLYDNELLPGETR